MSRRCKPGQRARIVDDSPHVGKIVVIVRPYRGEKVGDSTWVEELHPWVVTSLSGLLHWRRVDGSKRGMASTVVIDDRKLEPLSEDDDGLHVEQERQLPLVKGKQTV